jgi:hypothetical protein
MVMVGRFICLSEKFTRHGGTLLILGGFIGGMFIAGAFSLGILAPEGYPVMFEHGPLALPTAFFLIAALYLSFASMVSGLLG